MRQHNKGTRAAGIFSVPMLPSAEMHAESTESVGFSFFPSFQISYSPTDLVEVGRGGERDAECAGQRCLIQSHVTRHLYAIVTQRLWLVQRRAGAGTGETRNQYRSLTVSQRQASDRSLSGFVHDC